MRLFVALELPEPVRIALSLAWEDVLTALGRRSQAALTSVVPANYHATMKFLGEVHQDSVARLTAQLETAGQLGSPIATELTSYGVFPSVERPRVFWAGLLDTGAATALATLVDEAMADCGFAAEQQPWRPHVTVARVKRGQRVPGWQPLLASRPPPAVPCTISHVTLMRSVLSPSGAVYSPVARVLLGSS